MIRGFLRRPAMCLLAAAGLGLALPASSGTTYSTDFTDMWWNSSEDGWGMNVIQQGDIVFATFFVYGPDQSPRWYVGASLAPQSAPAGTFVFSGKLYSTTGPWFGGAFNTAVGVTEVGTATVTFSSTGTATLNYSVNGTAVTKQLTRLGWRLASPVGRFLGGFTFTASPCSDPNRQGNGYLQGIVTTTLNGTQVTFRVEATDGTGAVCTFSGGLAQQGRLSAVAGGTWSCVVGSTTPNQGTFSLTAIDVQVNGFNATWSANDQSCVYNGRFGGARDVVN
jgi:hypothetical protein